MLVANRCEILCSLYNDEIDTEKVPLMIQIIEIALVLEINLFATLYLQLHYVMAKFKKASYGYGISNLLKVITFKILIS